MNKGSTKKDAVEYCPRPSFSSRSAICCIGGPIRIWRYPFWTGMSRSLTTFAKIESGPAAPRTEQGIVATQAQRKWLIRDRVQIAGQPVNVRLGQKLFPQKRTFTSAQCQPRTSPHSITSSARTRTEGGIFKPSALAAWLLTTNSSLVGNSTGRSPGLAPLRILLTYAAAR